MLKKNFNSRIFLLFCFVFLDSFEANLQFLNLLPTSSESWDCRPSDTYFLMPQTWDFQQSLNDIEFLYLPVWVLSFETECSFFVKKEGVRD